MAVAHVYRIGQILLWLWRYINHVLTYLLTYLIHSPFRHTALPQTTTWLHKAMIW